MMTVDEMVIRFELARKEEELHRWMVEAIRKFIKQNMKNKDVMDRFVDMVKKNYPAYSGCVDKIMILV